jgi:cysteine desulfurase family protein (TIGR01976 family)
MLAVAADPMTDALDQRTGSRPGRAIDLSVVRDRFPALARTVDGRPCVFADAPGGTQVPRSVIDATVAYLERHNANVGGAFVTSVESDEVIEEARTAAAALLGCDADEVVFGPNMTTLNFHLSHSIARTLRPGDEVVVTHLDHDANISPWLLAARDSGAAVRWVDVRPGGATLDLDSLAAALGPKTRLVAFTLASNALGTVTPAAEIVASIRTRSPEAIVVADGVHFAPHRSMDVRALNVDVLFCSAYKFFGPHLGLMFARRDRLAAWKPYRVRPSSPEAPDSWETGTKDHEGLAGLVAAVEYLAGLGELDDPAPAERPLRDRLTAGMAAVERHEAVLSERFLVGLAGLHDVRLFGVADPGRIAERAPTFAFRVGDLHPRGVAEELGRQGIFVWDGNYYALAVMERLGLEDSGGAVRAGFCHYHSVAEVDRVLDALSRLGR